MPHRNWFRVILLGTNVQECVYGRPVRVQPMFSSLFCCRASYIAVQIITKCFALNAHKHAELIPQFRATNKRKSVPFIALANLGLPYSHSEAAVGAHFLDLFNACLVDYLIFAPATAMDNHAIPQHKKKGKKGKGRKEAMKSVFSVRAYGYRRNSANAKVRGGVSPSSALSTR